jgi:spermidine synthase
MIAALNISLILKGLIAIVMQILIIRELLVVFNGNELTIGIILAVWLILNALGSGLLGKLVKKTRRIEETYILLQISTLITLPLCILLARLSRNLFGILPAELINLFQMFSYSFLATVLFSVSDGMQFALGCKLAHHLNKQNIHAAGHVYILEALGMLLGGIVFTFILLPRFNSLEMVFLLSLCNILSALFLGFAIHERKLLFTLSCLLLMANVYLVSSDKVGKLQQKSLEYQWSNERIVDYQNSAYGNIVVAQKAEQTTFFSNGTPSVVTPLPDISFVEQFVHIPLLFHPHPADVLLLSGGVGGVIHEILKQPVKNIDYAELDPLIIKEVQKFPTTMTRDELKNRRVRVIFNDGRLLVKKTPERYDVVLVNLTSPNTLQLNRFYTQEFYLEAKKILKPGGLIAVRLPGSLTYLNDELRHLNSCIYNTLRSVYKFVYAVPMDFNLYLCSDTVDFNQTDLKTVQQRFEERQINTSYLTEFALRRQLDKSWQDWLYNSLAEYKGEKINRDFSPRGMFLALTFFYSLAWPQSKSIFSFLSRIYPLFIICSVIALAFIAIFLMRHLRKKIKLSIPLIIAMTGFAGISLELLIFWGFQVAQGYLYYLLALLSAAFMFGLAAGSFIINANLKRFRDEVGVLIKLELAIMFFAALLPVVLFFVGKFTGPDWVWADKIIFFTLSFAGGFLIGTEFPLANKIYSKQQEFMGTSAGSLYSFDLIGACLGSILTAVAFLPVLGTLNTCLLIVTLKLSGIAFLVFTKD